MTVTTAVAETTPQRNSYSEEERRQAMVLYAAESGREDRVKRLLAESDLGHVPYKTVREWATRTRKEQYQQIRSELDGYIREQNGDRFRAVTTRLVDVVDESARQYHEALKAGRVPVKDLSRGARDFSTPAGIFTDKGELLSGNPTARVSAEVEDVRAELASVGITVIMPTIEAGKEKAGDQAPTSPAPRVVDLPA